MMMTVGTWTPSCLPLLLHLRKLLHAVACASPAVLQHLRLLQHQLLLLLLLLLALQMMNVRWGLAA